MLPLQQPNFVFDSIHSKYPLEHPSKKGGQGKARPPPPPPPTTLMSPPHHFHLIIMFLLLTVTASYRKNN